MLKISIITITYNSAKTLQRTIDSVFNQTYNNFEYIIVDGNSNDNTLDIIKNNNEKFGGKLRWISEPDTGIYNAMNKGVKLATGQIVGLINSDDWLESNAFEIVAKHYNNTPLNIRNNALYCGAICFHASDFTQYFGTNEKYFYNSIKKMKLRGAWHPGTYVPKSVYDSVGLFDENFKIIGDVDFIYRCYVCQCKFVFFNDVLSNMSDGGASTQRNSYFLNDRLYAMKKNGKNNIKGFLNLGIALFIDFLKYHLPDSIIRKYRNRYTFNSSLK